MSREYFAGGDVDQAAPFILDGSPAGSCVRLGQCRYKLGLTVHHRHTVQMAAIFGGQSADEAGSSAWDKAVVVVQRAQARKQGVDDP